MLEDIGSGFGRDGIVNDQLAEPSQETAFSMELFDSCFVVTLCGRMKAVMETPSQLHIWCYSPFSGAEKTYCCTKLFNTAC